MNELSRVEDILRATIDSEPYEEEPQSRVEELLLELKDAIEEGGSGSDEVEKISWIEYNQLTPEEKVNGKW